MFLYNLCDEYISSDRNDSLLYLLVVYAASPTVLFVNYKIVSNWFMVWNEKYSPLPNRFILIYICKWALDLLRTGNITKNCPIIVMVLLRISIIICSRITSRGTVFRIVNIFSHFINKAYLCMILLSIVWQYLDYLTDFVYMEIIFFLEVDRLKRFIRMYIILFCYLSLSLGNIPLQYLEKSISDKIGNDSEKLSKVEQKFHQSISELSKYEIDMYVKYLDIPEIDHVANNLIISLLYCALIFCILGSVIILHDNSTDLFIVSCIFISVIAHIILFGKHIYKLLSFYTIQTKCILRRKIELGSDIQKYHKSETQLGVSIIAKTIETIAMSRRYRISNWFSFHAILYNYALLSQWLWRNIDLLGKYWPRRSRGQYFRSKSISHHIHWLKSP